MSVEPAMSELSRAVGDLIAVLFLAGEGTERRAVQRALELSPAELTRVVAAARGERLPGLLIQEQGDLLRLVTHPDAAAAVRRFTHAPGALRLSPAALETLAVIAYGQPATRGDVQAARGVNSDAAITTLQQHGLIAEAGRADGPGRPTLFTTTPDCLALLGIGSLADLPLLTTPEDTGPPPGPQR